MTEPTFFLRVKTAARLIIPRLPVVCSAFLGSLLIWPLLSAFPINGGDALWVSQSARALVGCARQGDWSGCPGTFQFGLTQHLPAMFLTWRGLGDDAVVFVLTLINFIAFGWLLYRGVRFFGGRSRLAWVFLLTFAVGPVYAYSVYSFSEGLILVFLIALVMEMSTSRRTIALVLLGFLCASSRETAFLTVMPLAIAIAVAEGGSWRSFLRRVRPMVIGVGSGTIAVLWFNYWKFGTIANPHYTDPIRRVPGLSLKIKNAIAIWVSPSGGVFPVWIVGGILALAIPTLLIIRFRHQRAHAVAAGVLLVGLVVQTGLLAAWYAPFGWVAWGPRLILPAVGATACAVMVLFAEEVKMLVETLRWRLVGSLSSLAIVSLSTLPNLGFILDRAAVANWFTPPGPLLIPGCVEPANIELNRQNYFDCALDFTPWQLGRTLWDVGLHQVGRGWGAIFVAFVVSLVGGLCVDHHRTNDDKSLLDG